MTSYMVLRTVNKETECWCAEDIDMDNLDSEYTFDDGTYEVIEISLMKIGMKSKTTYEDGLEVTSTSLADGYFEFTSKMPGR